jgi:hypothetical protein
MPSDVALPAVVKANRVRCACNRNGEIMDCWNDGGRFIYVPVFTTGKLVLIVFWNKGKEI